MLRERPRLRIAWLLPLWLLLWAGCGSNPETNDGLKPVPPASMVIERPIQFCGGGETDLFFIGYSGTEPQSTEVELGVVCRTTDDTLFHENYPGSWFLTEPKPATDSAQVDAIQAKMHDLAYGKLSVTPDSATAALAGGQPIISWELPGHVRRILYYSANEKKVMRVE